jgi:hypothetical protein
LRDQKKVTFCADACHPQPEKHFLTLNYENIEARQEVRLLSAIHEEPFMLSQPIFDDKSLSESLYRAIVRRFYESFSVSTQSILRDCRLGFAPSPNGSRTFFIVTPTLQVAEQLIDEIDAIINKVITLMAGISQIGICVAPPAHDLVERESNDSSSKIPRYMVCQFISLPCHDRECSE